MVTVANPEPKSPIAFLPYQTLWDEDEARFKAVVKSVRTGYTFAQCGGDAMRMVHSAYPVLWMSGDQAMSKEAGHVTKRMLDAIGAVCSYSENVREIVGDAEFVSDRIELKNGSRAIYFSSNPAAMRSFGGNVVLDEIAKHKDQKLAIGVALGRAARGHRVAMISSPNGAIGEFYEMANEAGLADQIEPQTQPFRHGEWSWHWCDIHRAKRMGLDIDIDALRRAYRDPELFAQEFECKFLDAESQYIPTDAVNAAVSDEASVKFPRGFVPGGPLYMGVDVGRTTDLTAFGVIEQLREFYVVRLVETMRKATFARQKKRSKELIPMMRRCAYDATGVGMQNAEELVREHPGRVEAVNFTLDVKAEMAEWMKRKIEDGVFKIPDDPLVKAHVTGVKRIVTTAGNTRFDGARSKKGHIDIFWALALAGHASDRPHQSMAEYAAEFGTAPVTARDIDAMAHGTHAGGDWFRPQPVKPQQRYGGIL